MPLFEVAFVKLPTIKEEEETGAGEELVFGPAAVIARDEKSAGVEASRKHGDKIKDVPEGRLETLVRPFGGKQLNQSGSSPMGRR